MQLHHGLRRVAAGAVFGSALLAAGMQDPATIKAQMRLADFRMVETMLTATAASAVIFYMSNRIGYTNISARKPITVGLFPYAGNAIGGALIGLGMATTGACPGSALVQAGIGGGSGVYTILGGILGAMLYVSLERAAEKSAASIDTSRDDIQMTDSPITGQFKIPELKKEVAPTVAGSLDIRPATMVVIWQVFALGIITLLRRASLSQASNSISPTIGGLLMGMSQLVSIILTRSSVGVSSAYEHVARVLLSPFLATQHKLFTPATMFATGAFVATFAMNALFLGYKVSPAPAIANHIVGGAALLFGARLARGCPSGHGISGIPTFGWSSFVTIAAAFASGIAFSAARAV
ncbi:hypothetical protein KVT40_009393 [Elsinoe batatas]|uniref:Sulphur transport domain-containing protein n=1 Tax=Elsinoe batatas TaxID=2601811 RepID=A0A8K0KTI1_9PEZI|nr:hypothetical protein KVT40_009393 [Elsinoe batatas]